MGDQCCITIRCRRVDAPRFEDEHYFSWPEWADDPESQEARNTPLAELHDDKGYCDPSEYPRVPFAGRHGKGWECGPADFCSDGRTVMYRPRTDNDGHYIRADAEGNPDPEDQRDLRAYLAFEREVEALLETTLTPGPELPRYAGEGI